MITKEITLQTLQDFIKLWDKLSPAEIEELEDQIVEDKLITSRFAGKLWIGFRGSIIEGGVEQAKVVKDAINPQNPADYVTLHEPLDGINMSFPPLLCAAVLQFLLSNPAIQQAVGAYFPNGIPQLVIPTPPQDDPEPDPDPPVENENP